MIIEKWIIKNIVNTNLRCAYCIFWQRNKPWIYSELLDSKVFSACAFSFSFCSYLILFYVFLDSFIIKMLTSQSFTAYKLIKWLKLSNNVFNERKIESKLISYSYHYYYFIILLLVIIIFIWMEFDRNVYMKF